MKAFRNVGGNIVQIDVDTDPDGNPILPADSTVDPMPVPSPGNYVTVVGNQWVQIPITQSFTTFERNKQMAIESLSNYKKWYLEQPVLYNGVMFDAGEKARNNLTQAVVIYTSNSYLPPAWIAADNSPYPLATFSDLSGIVGAVQSAFSSKFFEITSIRNSIMSAANDAELNSIVIPSIPLKMF